MTMSLDFGDLRESNDFLNALIDNITSAIFLVDRDVKIRNFNDPFQALFQKDEDKILGERCGNVIGCAFTVDQSKDCGETKNCNECELRRSILRSFFEKVPTYREKIVRDFYIQGEKISKYFQFSTKYIQWGQETMVLIIVDDITALETQKLILEQQNRELEDLNRQKNEFCGMAAHDLRNPITVIQNSSSIILKYLGENLTDKQKEFLKKINDSSQFTIKLLSDLLDISKIESGRLELEITQNDYIDFLKNNIELNNFFANEKDISINLGLRDEILLIDFDRNKIEQVLNNLISNAIKYSYPNTEINIEVEREGDFLLTKVIDQGQGIPEDEQPNIFKAFQKASTKPTAGEKSTGLGLAIAKKIVEGHKGEIWVKSEVGKGSAFYFKLPMAGKPASNHENSSNSPPP
jgi:signal transduction histidine kinase